MRRQGRNSATKRPTQRGFSLVEVVMAIGLAAFVLVSLMALLPLGIKVNKTSAEETRAVNILTSLEADLRNARSPNSLFGFPLPYVTDAAGTTFNPALTTNTTNTLATNATKGLQEDETPGAIASSRYQASVIYTTIPPAGSLLPVEARLIVNWPASTNTLPQDLVSKSQGYVETFVSFPAP